VRTSSGAFLSHAKYGNDAVIKSIEDRMDQWAVLPHGNGESLQILRYHFDPETGAGQEYKPHFDYFFDEEHAKNNRMATILVYLSTPVAGGETIFPDALISHELRQMDTRIKTNSVKSGMGDRVDSKTRMKEQFLKTVTPYSSEMNHSNSSGPSECAQNKLHVKAREGDAILFWSMTAGGELDKGAKHGSCPVLEGEKWSATKWYHVHDFKNPSNVEPKLYTTMSPSVPAFSKNLIGHVSVSPSTCRDENENCASWAEAGECERNAAYMEVNCMRSCGKC